MASVDTTSASTTTTQTTTSASNQPGNDMDGSEHLNTFLNEKRKRKSKRRSSLATSEAMKLMTLAADDQISEKELLEKIAFVQYEWINGQLEQLKKWQATTKERAQSAARQLASTSLSTAKLDDEFVGQSREQLVSGLNVRQREFLKAHELDEKLIVDYLKRMRQRVILAELNKIKRNEAPDSLRKCSYLSNQLSRSTTFQSSCAAMMVKSTSVNQHSTNNERLDPFEILINYFNS